MSDNIVRLRRGFTHTGPRLLLALVLALGMTVLVSTATQQSAHAAVSPAAVGVAHQCETIGTASNGNQAVVCSDINATPVAGGTEIWGTGEYFCQGPSVRCAGISSSNNLTVLGFGTMGTAPFHCSTTGCPNGGRAEVSTTHFFVGAGTCVLATGTVDGAAAILVNGASAAFHPKSLQVSASICS
jgi:hypothetical protein